MGRKGRITTLHIIVLGVLVLAAAISVITYTNVAHLSLQFGGRATPAPAGRRPLVELALAGPEIQDDLGSSSPLVLNSSTRLCEIPRSIECFQAAYGSAGGDQVVLLLSRFTNLDDAVDFGLRMKYQLDEEQKGTEILVRVTPEDFRWLERADNRGITTYHGGGNEGGIAIYVTWQPVRALSDDNAALLFSSLLGAQLKKFDSAP